VRQEADSVEKRNKILAFMLKQEGVEKFVNSTSGLLATYNQLFPDENLQVAFCCSAGEYRSPAMVELVHNRLQELGILSLVKQSPNSKL